MGIWICPHCGKALPRSLWDDRMRTAKMHPDEMQALIAEAQEVQSEQNQHAPPPSTPRSWDPEAATDPGHIITSTRRLVRTEFAAIIAIVVAAASGFLMGRC